jgi:hypothetical protein
MYVACQTTDDLGMLPMQEDSIVIGTVGHHDTSSRLMLYGAESGREGLSGR